MKKYSLLFFLLLPVFLFSLDETTCKRMRRHATYIWGEHVALIKKFQDAKEELTEVRMGYLEKALEYCYEALELQNAILHDFSTKSQRRQNKYWRLRIKERCDRDREQLLGQIAVLEKALQDMRNTQLFTQATQEFQLSQQLEAYALEIYHHCKQEVLDYNEGLLFLDRCEEYYKEAIALIHNIHGLLEQIPDLPRQNFEEIAAVLAKYEHSLEEVGSFRLNWAQIVAEKTAMAKSNTEE